MLLPKREQKSDLRTDTGHTTFEIAELCAPRLGLRTQYYVPAENA
jgi:hypothetical protein